MASPNYPDFSDSLSYDPSDVAPKEPAAKRLLKQFGSGIVLGTGTRPPETWPERIAEFAGETIPFTAASYVAAPVVGALKVPALASQLIRAGMVGAGVEGTRAALQGGGIEDVGKSAATGAALFPAFELGLRGVAKAYRYLVPKSAPQVAAQVAKQTADTIESAVKGVEKPTIHPVQQSLQGELPLGQHPIGSEQLDLGIPQTLREQAVAATRREPTVYQTTKGRFASLSPKSEGAIAGIPQTAYRNVRGQIINIDKWSSNFESGIDAKSGRPILTALTPQAEKAVMDAYEKKAQQLALGFPEQLELMPPDKADYLSRIASQEISDRKVLDAKSFIKTSEVREANKVSELLKQPDDVLERTIMQGEPSKLADIAEIKLTGAGARVRELLSGIGIQDSELQKVVNDIQLNVPVNLRKGALLKFLQEKCGGL